MSGTVFMAMALGLLLVSPTSAFLGWPAVNGAHRAAGGQPSHQSLLLRGTRAGPSGAQQQQRQGFGAGPDAEGLGALEGATPAQIEEYHSIMEALRVLQDQGLIELEDGHIVVANTGSGRPTPVCGNRMVETITRLCLAECTTHNDVAGRLCSHGMSDAEVIASCCPTTAREPLPKNFVF